MPTVWKYDLTDCITMDGVVSIELPAGATVIHAGYQPPSQAMIWAEVDPEQPTQVRTFRIVGTGHPVPERHRHVASWQAGAFVWHLYQPLGHADFNTVVR